jgi:aminoglycoside phosphotransferase (APT) family kinase protein
VAPPLLPAEVAAGAAAILGERAIAVEDLTSPWTATTRSVLVVTEGSAEGGAGGGTEGGGPKARAEGGAGRFVVQWSVTARASDRRAMGRRMRIGRDLARLAPRLPVPEILGGDISGPAPFVVSRFVPGISARELLGDEAGAAIVGTAVGRVQREIDTIPTARLRLSRTWADPDHLAAAARRWLAEAGPSMSTAEAQGVRDTIDLLPDAFARVRPVFAHGDLAPVNVLIRDGAVVALLDFERARLAHPLFDAAWWSWILRYHHATLWRAAGGAYLSAAGIDQNPRTLAQLKMLAVLQCLEMAASTPRRAPDTRREWVSRVAQILEWGRD